PTTSFASGATAHSNPVESRSRTITSSPLSRSSHTMWLPMYPAPPVTKTAMKIPHELKAGKIQRLRTQAVEAQRPQIDPHFDPRVRSSEHRGNAAALSRINFDHDDSIELDKEHHCGLIRRMSASNRMLKCSDFRRRCRPGLQI